MSAGGRYRSFSTFDDAMDYDIRKLTDYLWELPKTGGMRVPARIYATEGMIAQIVNDKAPQQAANVAHLPGIVTASLAMPDIHWGYGFPSGCARSWETSGYTRNRFSSHELSSTKGEKVGEIAAKAVVQLLFSALR